MMIAKEKTFTSMVAYRKWQADRVETGKMNYILISKNSNLFENTRILFHAS
jgi:hypothetical protein